MFERSCFSHFQKIKFQSKCFCFERIFIRVKIAEILNDITGKYSFMIDSNLNLFMKQRFLPQKPLFKSTLLEILFNLKPKFIDYLLMLNTLFNLSITFQNIQKFSFDCFVVKPKRLLILLILAMMILEILNQFTYVLDFDYFFQLRCISFRDFVGLSVKSKDLEELNTICFQQVSIEIPLVFA